MIVSLAYVTNIPGWGGGGTSIYGLYRYVPRNRVWFLSFFFLKWGIFFYPFVTVFLVWSFERLAKLYYLILERKTPPKLMFSLKKT